MKNDMKKLDSTLKNLVLSLTLITAVVSILLAWVYKVTEGRIEEQKREVMNKARLAVSNGRSDAITIEVEENGFGGVFRLMVGFDRQGNILGYEVLEHQETPGLGSHMAKWFKNENKPKQNIIGRKANGSFRVSKDGGEIDAITAATISSRAFLNAINKAYEQFKSQNNE